MFLLECSFFCFLCLFSPLMLNDSSTTHSMPKYSRQYSLESTHSLPVSTLNHKLLFTFI